MRIGSLCTGYGGLDMAVERVLGGSVAWASDVDKGARKILAHRYFDVPNLGDFTTQDWSQVEPIDVLTAGFPCQPVSNAGKQLGDKDERWLWDDVLRAIRDLRPGLVFLENVRGLLTAGGGRLFGRVVGSLADIGYDATWVLLPAAGVGAPHRRLRVFIAAYPNSEGLSSIRRIIAFGRDVDRRRGEDESGKALEPASLFPTPRASDTNGPGAHGEGGVDLRTAVSLMPTPRAGDGTKGGPNQRGSSGDLMLPSAVVTLPTPTARDWKNVGDPAKTAGRMAERGQPLGEVVVNALLPTPAVNDMGEGKTPEAWDEWTDAMKAKHGNGNGHGPSLSIEAQRHVCDPRPVMGTEYACECGAVWDILQDELPQPWGPYTDAIGRWEKVTRPAPPATERGLVRHVCGGTESCACTGNPRLSPRFSEWLMGLPDGWVTEVPGITRNEALKACGNGVVPQQAEAALRHLLPLIESEVAA